MSWDPPLPYALLLQEDDGHKYTENNKRVVKGSLLVKLSQEEIKGAKQQLASGLLPFNFRCLEDPKIKLYCSSNKVYPLNELQKDYLFGIGSASDRYAALGKLEWTQKLTEGSTCYVSIPAFTTAAKGKVHYIGRLPGENGIKFGVELLVCRNVQPMWHHEL